MSAKTEIILTIAKISPLIILSVLLLPFLNESNFYPFYPASSFDFLKAIVIVYWSFTGFGITALFSDETKGGQKIVYRTLKIVIGITIFIYIFFKYFFNWISGKLCSGIFSCTTCYRIWINLKGIKYSDWIN